MASRRRRNAALAAAAALIAIPTAIGCSAIDKAFDCAQTAVAITDSVNDLQQAVSNAGNSPQEAKEALDQIEKNLGDLGDKTDNADVGKAVDDLTTGVKNVRDAIETGDATPDITPVTDAASELTNVCSP
ncbi:hypothetical protein NLX86_15580 [Streptomyces sp. A3M-1-3]|uniref:hypothetical protein n=1 Tax=Streptomyces sp. A3M-1-3 TaxID=2962044 RepID=UPI0020B780FE|nr:hypothetical protein [Streptomyces sp. A3M-1-3]MCP3819474.1 hypothetical protein [Streptomyces sp. A3M-1-3]